MSDWVGGGEWWGMNTYRNGQCQDKGWRNLQRACISKGGDSGWRVKIKTKRDNIATIYNMVPYN